MKLLVVMPYYKPATVYGGPTHSVSALCEGLARAGVQVTVMTTDANGPTRLDVALRATVMVDGVEVIYYPLGRPSLGTFFYSPELIREAVKRVPEFDLAGLEVMWSSLAYPLSKACKRQEIPYVISIRGQLLPWALRKSRLKKTIYWQLVGKGYMNGAAGLHCTDPVEVRAVSQLGLSPPTFVVPNSLNTARFESMPVRGHFRHKYGITEDASVLLFLGRLLPLKRPDIAIDALAQVRLRFPNVHLILAGPDEGGLWTRLQQQAQQLGCLENVHMTGLLKSNEVLQVLADSDMLLMPTEIQENFGMAAAEAMAAGLPVLVSDGIPVGVWAEKVGAGRILPCEAPEFAEAVCELLAEPKRMKVMGQQGRELVRENFDFDVTTRQMLRQYEAIIQTGRPLPDSSI